MIDGLKPYPAYKASGLWWLGKVPERWAIASLRLRYSQCLGKMLDSKRITGDHLLPYLRNIDVQWDHINTDRLPLMDIAPREYERFTVRPGDLLVCEGGEVGRAAIWGGDIPLCGFQKALHRLRPHSARDDEPRYMYYALRVASGLGAFADGHESTIGHLTGEKLRAHRFPFPPCPEQSAIVRFLDHADRLIRRYIRAKKKLIALLNEQKQAIINLAVTRGLDPNVKLKPSGVEWLGDVPEHWEARRLKTLVVRIDQGVSPQAENQLADGPSWGVLKAGCVNHGVFRETEHKRLPSGFEFDPLLAVSEGDVLASRACGSPRLVGSVGRVSVLKYRLILSDKTFMLIFNRGIEPSFMVLAMNSRYYRDQVRQAISGAEGLANNLPLSCLRSFVFAVPPTHEQRRIVEAVHESTAKLARVSSRAEREVELLQEFRIRLIADVVTGKLDVREAAARLPAEPAEPEAIEALEESDEIDVETEASDVEEEAAA